MIDMKQVITGVTMAKACSIKADADSVVVKTVNLRVKFDGATLQGVFDKALSSAVIQWQNGKGRKSFDELKNNQVVEIAFTSPARTVVDPMEAIIASAKASGLTVEQDVMEELKRRKS